MRDTLLAVWDVALLGLEALVMAGLVAGLVALAVWVAWWLGL